MSFVKRAWLHITRKRGKSLILFCLLVIMTTLILTSLSIRAASDTAALDVRQSLRAGFTLDAKAAEGQMTENIVQQILSIEGIKSDYNSHSNSYAEYQRSDGTLLETLTDGAFDVSDGFEHAGRLRSDMYSEKDSFFMEQGFDLIEGRHITAGDKNVVLVHAYFARINNLAVGDTIRLALNDTMAADYDGQTVDAEIVGIFTNTEMQNENSILSHMFYENIVFTDPYTYWHLHGNGGMLAYDYADFRVDDPAELENIMDNVKQIEGVDWKVCSFQRHDMDYQNAKNALEALRNMVEVMMVAVVVVSLLLLILILALWVRSRGHEIGILLSVGFSKIEILMQHICEAMMLAVAAFVLAVGISVGISQNIGDSLLTRTSASEYEVVDVAEDTVQSNDTALTEIEVKITMQEIWFAALVESCMVAFSVLVSVIPVLTLKPRNILSKVS